MKRTLSLILSLLMVLSLFTGLNVGAVTRMSESDLADTGADAEIAETGEQTIDAAYVTGVIEPVAGATPTYSASVPSDKGYRVMNSNSTTMKNGVGWYNWTDYEYMTESDTFEAGKQYEVIVELDPDDGYSFASNVSGFLNGFDSSVYHYPYNNHIDVSRIFTCPAVLIDSVSVTGVAEPYAGAAPTYSASVPTGKGYQIKTDYWTNGVWWYNSTDDKTMTASDTFEAGKEYNLTVLLKTAGNNISFASYVSGSLNNKSAKVYNYGDGTVAVYLTYTCPGILINSVAVTEITAPMPGAYPDMSCKLPSNCGYKTVYYSGDITWYTEEGDILNPDTDKFVDGEKYNAQVELLALDGYEFAESGLTGTINGTSATVRVLLPKKKLTVSRWFTCHALPITSASCTVTEPVAGQKPSYTATVPAGKGYQVEEDFTDGTWVNGVLWQNVTDNKDMTESDTFENGKQYTATVLLDSAAGYSFASNVSGIMNSDYAKVIFYGNSTIGVYRTFTCQTTAILGDVDFDGNIEIRDATWIQRYTTEMDLPFTVKKKTADIDGDDNITVMDATLIQYYLANMKNPHNIGKTL